MLANMTEKRHRPMSRNKLDLMLKLQPMGTIGHAWIADISTCQHRPL